MKMARSRTRNRTMLGGHLGRDWGAADWLQVARHGGRTVRSATAWGFAVAIALCLAASPDAMADPLPVGKLDRKEPIDFQKDVVPIFRKKCLACHNASDAEGDLVLESVAAVKKGGGSGAAVVPGKPQESLLLRVARHAEEPVMPPEDNDVGAKNLTPMELALLSRWIAEGAKGSALGAKADRITWQPLPPGSHAIYTVAMDPSGTYAAAGRANQVTLYHLGGRRMVLRMTDPGLIKQGLYKHAGVAHLDFVQSLAFHPSGEILASGGYRTIKLWRRVAQPKGMTYAAGGAPMTSLAMLPDGTAWFSGDASGVVRRFVAGNSKPTAQWKASDQPIVALAATPDGARVASADGKGLVRLWDAGGKQAGEFHHTPQVTSIAWIGGDRLVVAGGGKTAKVWKLEPVKGSPDPKATDPKAADPKTPAAKSSDPKLAWQVVLEFKGFGGETTAVAWRSSRHEVIVASKDGTVRTFNDASGKPVRTMKHGGSVEAIGVSSDGQRIVSLSSSKTGKIWDNTNGKMLAEFRGDVVTKRRQKSLEFQVSLADARVAAAKRDVDAAKKRRTAEEASKKKTDEDLKKAAEDLKKKQEAVAKPKSDHEAGVKKVAELKGKRDALQAAVKARDVGLAKAKEEKQAADQSVATAKKMVVSLKQSEAKAKAAWDKAKQASDAKKDDKKLADASATQKQAYDQAVAARQAAEAKVKQAEMLQRMLADRIKTETEAQKKDQAEIKKLAGQIKAAESSEKKLAEALKKAESAVAAAGRALDAAKRTAERGAKLLELSIKELADAEKRLKELEGVAKGAKETLATANKEAGAKEPLWISVALTPGGGTIVTGSADGRLVTWDTATGSPLEQYSVAPGKRLYVAARSDDRLIVGAGDGALAEWPVLAPWELVRTIGDPNDPSQLYDRVTALAFDPSGTKLASGSGDPSRSGQLRLWDVEHGTMLREFPEAHSDTVLDLAFSPEGDRLASSAADRFVKVFDVDAGKVVRAFEGHTGHVLGVSWSGDSRQLASSGADQVIKIWDAATGDQKRTISGFKKEVTDVQFVGLSNQVLLTAGDPLVQIRRADNGGVVRTFSGVTGYAYSGATDRSGALIAAGSHDGVLRIWKADGKLIATFDK